MNDFRPAQRVARINESPSSFAAARVRELKANGVDVLDLTVGEPDFDTPEHVKEAAVRAIAAGETKYTAVNGTPALRAAIRGRLERALGLTYEDRNLTVGGGAKQLIFLAFMASLDAGDEVIVPAPYWVSYPDMVRANDGTPVIVQTGPDSGYKLTPQSLQAALTDRSRWIVLNTPSNPTGAVYTRDELAALADVVAARPDVLVLSDEIYDEICYVGQRSASILDAAPQLREQVLLANGVSKSYAMTGWRLGYAAGPAAVIGAINKLQSQISSCPSSISQAAAAAALSGPQQFVSRTVATYKDRRDRIVELLKSIDGLDPIEPQGAFYVYTDCSGLIGKRTASGDVLRTDQDVVLYLLDVARVAVIQGSAYGVSPFFRISFATDLATLEAAAAAMADAIDALKE